MELNKELNKTATESKSKLTAMIMTVYNSFFATNIRGEAAKFVGLGNYFSIFQDPLFLKSLAGTLVYVVAFAAITIVAGVVLARLATMKLRRISWFQTAFAGTMGTSAAAASILWLFLFNPSVSLASFALKAMGMTNANLLVDPTGAMIVIVLASVWMALGFGLKSIFETDFKRHSEPRLPSTAQINH
ncbi:sn-glycerol-3-phosphate transport system permease protein UgpA [Lacticaseibacillus paracasei]|nr:sn-glycerol-3-phosphate transport system permease protein UgpA [Lacticaseibacillus paracasei]